MLAGIAALALGGKSHSEQAETSAHVAQKAAHAATEGVTDLQAVRRLALERDDEIEREVRANRATIRTLQERIQRLEAKH